MYVVAMVAAVAAVVAAGVAIWQALDARGSRLAAEESEKRATEQAKLAIAEAGRAADAQQLIAKGVARITQPSEPWVLRPDKWGTFTLRNDGGRRVVSTRAVIVDEDDQPAGDSVDEWVMSERTTWEKGSASRLRPVDSGGGLTSPAQVILRVWWRELDDADDVADQEYVQRIL